MRTEFEFIQNIKEKFGLDKVGDDCAILTIDKNNRCVVTTDMLIEDIDFRLDWTTPEFLGHKALAVSLSDVAAMGAEPKWAMLSLGVPEKLWKGDFLGRLYEGWHELAQKFDVEMIGGDISRSPDRLVLDSIAGGVTDSQKPIQRSTARPGDTIFVSGTLGGAAGGLKLLERGELIDKTRSPSLNALILKQLAPNPKVELAVALRSRGLVSAMIDISDGFSSDLNHLCTASGVGAIIDSLPIDKTLLGHFPMVEVVEMALNGGEDFEILFTVPPEKVSEVKTFPVYAVGITTADPGVIELVTDGRKQIIEPMGFHHF